VLEAEELVGHEFNEDEDHVIAVREMVGLGAQSGIMTAPDGCYALMAPEEPGGQRVLYRVRMPGGSIEPRATVGSGDAFLAGFVASRYAGRAHVDCLAYGVACAAGRGRLAGPRDRILGGFSGLHNAARRLE
jgi:1-phosphofructokinase/tagatose 6-phosphate kinase